eukprot:scaffold6883_cov113-Cylindrotheca_fusiformis.AAC.4
MEENDLRQPSQMGKPSIQWTTKEMLTLWAGHKACRMDDNDARRPKQMGPSRWVEESTKGAYKP